MDDYLYVDTHVHVYPQYNVQQCLRMARSHLVALKRDEDENAHYAICLTERFDCNFYEALRTGEHPVCESCDVSGDHKALSVHLEAGLLHIYPGRQVVSREGVEVLSLLSDERIEDRKLSLEELCEASRAKGAIPTIAWAPGKWLFSRDRVVEGAIRSQARDGLLLGDSSLRPTVWGLPSLMRQGRARGVEIVAGSDPLPFEGEEIRAGTYASRIACDFRPDDPAGSFRDGLDGGRIDSVGRRGGLLTVLKRLLENEKVRRRS